MADSVLYDKLHRIFAPEDDGFLAGVLTPADQIPLDRLVEFYLTNEGWYQTLLDEKLNLAFSIRALKSIQTETIKRWERRRNRDETFFREVRQVRMINRLYLDACAVLGRRHKGLFSPHMGIHRQPNVFRKALRLQALFAALEIKSEEQKRRYITNVIRYTNLPKHITLTFEQINGTSGLLNYLLFIKEYWHEVYGSGVLGEENAERYRKVFDEQDWYELQVSTALGIVGERISLGQTPKMNHSRVSLEVPDYFNPDEPCMVWLCFVSPIWNAFWKTGALKADKEFRKLDHALRNIEADREKDFRLQDALSSLESETESRWKNAGVPSFRFIDDLRMLKMVFDRKAHKTMQAAYNRMCLTMR